MLGVERDQDKAMNRKRLLEERLLVKKSICLVNDTNSILWETREMQEQQKHTIGVYLSFYSLILFRKKVYLHYQQILLFQRILVVFLRC